MQCYQFVACSECGYEQIDMGKGVMCEQCGEGPMPTYPGAEYESDFAEFDEEIIMSCDLENPELCDACQ